MLFEKVEGKEGKRPLVFAKIAADGKKKIFKAVYKITKQGDEKCKLVFLIRPKQVERKRPFPKPAFRKHFTGAGGEETLEQSVVFKKLPNVDHYELRIFIGGPPDHIGMKVALKEVSLK